MCLNHDGGMIKIWAMIWVVGVGGGWDSCLWAQAQTALELAAVEIKKARALCYEDAQASLNISYKWANDIQLEKDLSLWVEAYLVHGINNQMNTSFEAASYLFDSALMVADSCDVPIATTTKAELKARNGNLKNAMGESAEGLASILAAKTAYQQIGDSLHLYWTDALLGECYARQMKWDMAKEIGAQAVKKLEKMGASIELCDAYNYYVYTAYLEFDAFFSVRNWSTTPIPAHLNPQQAVAYAELSLQTAQKLNSTGYTAFAMKSKGYAAYMQKQLDEAKAHFRQSAALFAKTHILYYEMEALSELALCYQVQSDYAKAIEIAEPISRTAAENGWFTMLTRAYRFLAVAHYALGHYEQGASYGGKSFTFLKHISNSKRSFELDAEMATYKLKNQELIAAKTAQDLEKANREKWLYLILSGIALLSVGSLLVFVLTVKKKNAVLKKLSEENAFLLGEANHRIKNNLQIIASLIAKTANKEQHQAVGELTKLSTQIGAIASLHQQLYTKEQKDMIDLTAYLEELCRNLQSLVAAKKITLDIVSDKIVCSVNKAVYIGLLINELCVNSVKHAFGGDGEARRIHTVIKKQDKGIAISYADNGQGIPEGKRPSLVDLFCRQLKATYTIQSDHEGTRFFIIFPLESVWKLNLDSKK